MKYLIPRFKIGPGRLVCLLLVIILTPDYDCIVAGQHVSRNEARSFQYSSIHYQNFKRIYLREGGVLVKNVYM